MGKLFTSLYIYILISLLIFSGAIEQLWPHKKGEEAIMLGSQFSQSLMLLAQTESGVKKILNTFPSEMISMDQIAFLPSQALKLKKKDPVLLFDTAQEAIWYLPVKNNKLLVIGPLKVISQGYDSSWPYILILAFIGLPIGLWSFWLWRDFNRLRLACENINTSEELHLTAKTSSMLLPITETLLAMKKRINRLLNSQKELTSAVSHEFRTPLARIKFAMAMLMDSQQDENNTKYLTGIQYDIAELESLVSEMLSYAKMDNEVPKLDIQGINLVEVCANVIEKLGFTAACKLNLVAPSELFYLCDGHFITRSIQNLIGNAVKYANSEVTVKIIDEHNEVFIKIIDDGPGIDEAQWDNVFKPFYRLDKSRDKKTGGFGLGLAIVSKILMWHDGLCYIERVATAGTCFTIRLPKNKKASV